MAEKFHSERSRSIGGVILRDAALPAVDASYEDQRRLLKELQASKAAGMQATRSRSVVRVAGMGICLALVAALITAAWLGTLYIAQTRGQLADPQPSGSLAGGMSEKSHTTAVEEGASPFLKLSLELRPVEPKAPSSSATPVR